MGYNCEMAYNIALCHYKMKQLAPSLKNIAEIIEKGVREHPELGVGANADGIEVKSKIALKYKTKLLHLKVSEIQRLFVKQP